MVQYPLRSPWNDTVNQVDSDEILKPHFYKIPSLKVLFLGAASFGIYLIYWYLLQYSRSNHPKPHSPFYLLLALIFNLWSILIFYRMKHRLEERGQQIKFHGLQWFILKYAMLLMATVHFKASYYTVFVIFILTESIYVGILQSIINKHHTQHRSAYTQPWRKVGLFHYSLILAGLGLLASPFFNHSINFSLA